MVIFPQAVRVWILSDRVLEPKFPSFDIFPQTVRLKGHFKVPVFDIVRFPVTLIVAAIETGPLMITLSTFGFGITHPTQVEELHQTPPVVVEFMLAARTTLGRKIHEINTAPKIFKNNFI